MIKLKNVGNLRVSFRFLFRSPHEGDMTTPRILILGIALLAGCVDSTSESVQNVEDIPGKFEVFQGIDNQYYFHLLAGNNEKVLQSEGYTNISGARSGVESVRVNGVDLSNYDVLQATNEEWYFNLIAQNHEIIGTSETYVSRYNAEQGTEVVQYLVTPITLIEDAVTDDSRFELFIGSDNRYYFHLVARNGEIVLQSEGYEGKNGALNGIDSVRDNGQIVEQYEVIEAQNGQYFFRLKAQNYEVIARSELYASLSNAERGMTTVVELLQSGEVTNP